MSHVGVMCPNTRGHLNAMLALAEATRARGHRVTFFLLGEPPHRSQPLGLKSSLLGGRSSRLLSTRPRFRSSAHFRVGQRSSIL